MVQVSNGCALLGEGLSGPHSSVVERILGKNEVPSSILGVGSKLSTNKYQRKNKCAKSAPARETPVDGAREKNGKASI